MARRAPGRRAARPSRESTEVKWTPGRALLAAAVRALQMVTLDRDIHSRLGARARRLRERRREAAGPLDDERLDKARRVLVCKTEQRGDVILALPALAAIRARFPGARLSVLSAPWSREILVAAPGVDEVVVLDHPPQSFESARGPTSAERAALLGALRERAFDLAVDLSGDPWTLELLAEAGIPARVGPADTGASHLLHRSVPIPPDLHRIEAMLAIAALVGAPGGDAVPRLVPPDAARREYERLAGELGLEPPYLVIHPGGRELKRWPIERHVDLAKRLALETGDTLVILLGPDERELAAAFVTALPPGRVRLWPGGSFLAAGELLRRARLYVGSDSGVAHLAAAVGTATVTIFGPARISQWAPRSAQGLALSTDESCAYPCWPALYAEPCSHHRCLRRIQVEEVLAHVHALLAGGRAGATR